MAIFDPPTESTPLDQSPKNLLLVITSATPMGGFWANGWNITKIFLFIYLFIFTFFSSTHLQVRPVDGFSRLMAQTTRIRARMGGFWANGWNITKIFLFIYLFIYTFFSSTHLQVRPGDGFSRLIAQTTRIRARMCLLRVSLTLLPILRVKYPKNPNFGGVNRRFHAKRTKYSKFHIIESTAAIPTKFSTTIQTTK